MSRSDRQPLSRTRHSVTAAIITLAVVLVAAVIALTTPEDTMLIGVYQPNSPGSTGQVTAFAKAAGFTPRITSYYSTFQQPFALSFAQQMAAQRTTVLVQWQPRGTTNSAVANGSDDAYIKAFADSVKSLNYQVILSYGQEMNGNWYDWGKADTPANYIAAYQHVWRVFNAEGVHNVTWLWDPNIIYNGSTAMALLYPGDKYVDWVGLDGYFSTPTTTFNQLFGPSIEQLREVSAKPLLIAESGVTGSAGPGQITDLFAGASLAGAIGVVYFDQAQTGDSEHQDWRLEDNAAAMAAFKAAVQTYAERPLT